MATPFTSNFNQYALNLRREVRKRFHFLYFLSVNSNARNSIYR